MLKKRLIPLLALFGALVFVPVPAQAQQDVCDLPSATGSAFCDGQNDPDANANATDNAVLDILDTVVSILTTITAVIAVIVIVIAGLMYTVSAGDPSRANQARSTIIYAIVALVVSVMARVILIVILDAIA